MLKQLHEFDSIYPQTEEVIVNSIPSKLKELYDYFNHLEETNYDGIKESDFEFVKKDIEVYIILYIYLLLDDKRTRSMER